MYGFQAPGYRVTVVGKFLWYLDAIIDGKAAVVAAAVTWLAPEASVMGGRSSSDVPRP
jgi:hypothetical protein